MAGNAEKHYRPFLFFRGFKMKKIISTIMIGCTLSIPFAQMGSEQKSAGIITPPRTSIRGDKITFTSHQYAPKHFLGTVSVCKGAMVIAPGHSGFLAVHYAGDSTGMWVKEWLDSSGFKMGAEFDIVGDSTKGTTVHFDSTLYIFPYLFK
jgi:hypothetical protein